MSLIEVTSELNYQVDTPTRFLLCIAAAKTPYQIIRKESIALSPEHSINYSEVGSENNRIFRFSASPGKLKISYRAIVELNQEFTSPPEMEEVDFCDIPASVLPFLNPSRYCESDRLKNFAEHEFSHMAPGVSRVEAICDWVYNRLSYIHGTTDASTGACDVLLQLTGVCRDFSHVAISLCRALGIPARYVSGYAVGLEPPDFHGFFEAFLGNRWHLFDATRLAPINGLVRIATGFDAADTAFSTEIGTVTLDNMKVLAIELTDEIVQQETVPSQGVSTV